MGMGGAGVDTVTGSLSLVMTLRVFGRLSLWSDERDGRFWRSDNTSFFTSFFTQLCASRMNSSSSFRFWSSVIWVWRLRFLSSSPSVSWRSLLVWSTRRLRHLAAASLFLSLRTRRRSSSSDGGGFWGRVVFFGDFFGGGALTCFFRGVTGFFCFFAGGSGVGFSVSSLVSMSLDTCPPCHVFINVIVEVDEGRGGTKLPL